MKYGYKEVRQLGSSDLRALCIAENWYTGGTNEEYSNLMQMAKKENITTDDIVEIATDIYEHSLTAMRKLKREAGYETGECLAHIMFLVNEKCRVYFEEC